MVARKTNARDCVDAMLANVPVTVFAGVPKLPASASDASVTPVPPEQLWPAPGLVTVESTKMDPGTNVVLEGTRSEMLILVAVAPPEAFATEIQYSTTAPGTDLKLLVLTPSLMTRLDLNTLNTAA